LVASLVDIHCHLLPGLDDGPDSLAESLQMAEMAIADGITHVIATPHASDRYAFDAEKVRKRREELQDKLGERLQIGTGCDFHLSYENLEDLRKNHAKYSLNQKNYLLVEFADFAIPPTIDKTLHELHLSGLRPIVTHPERNGLIRSSPARLENWIRQGCYVQVTALSLLGRFGSSAQQFSEWLLAQDAIHFFASDAHNTKGRPMLLRSAFEEVARRRGAHVAHALFLANPMAVWEGQPLPYVPEPPEFEDAPRPAKKKRFGIF
jgi:protein-tyrosine phosphatase